ncbi:hypothetical protein A4X13_0g3611 [Tilletia indica]|uniref:Uncharacterized protein n=1 Tax=Tilletia indica TaxID=43049 RepID=A0A177TLK2_9BASI|nr:hypothetical protein A4X13_0g3611 [Tilletia indica]
MMASSATADSSSGGVASAGITRPLFASREASQASTSSSSTSADAYMSPTTHDLPGALGIMSTSSSTLSDNNAHAQGQPLTHASYSDNMLAGTALDDEDDTIAATATRSYLPQHQQQKQRSFSSSSSSGGTASPSTTILPPSLYSSSNNKVTGSLTDDGFSSRSPSNLGTGTGQVARGGRLASYPPKSEEDDEAREVERNLERWAAEERQRRKALRASRTNSLLGPPAASALARRLSSLRRSSVTPQGRPLSQIGANGGGGAGGNGDASSPGEHMPLEELAEEEGESSNGSYSRRTGQQGSRRSSGYGPPGPLRKLNGSNGRESVSSLDSYTSADALTRSGSNQAALPGVSAIHHQAVSPNTTPTLKQVGFFESGGSSKLLDLEHVSEGDPASNGTPKAARLTGSNGDAIGRLKGKSRALDYEADSTGANRNPFEDEADAEGDVSSAFMSPEHDLTDPSSQRKKSTPGSTPQLRITPDHSGSSSQHQQQLSRSNSSYASSTLPAYAKPKPSALRPIVTVGREAPATLERQRRDSYLVSGNMSGPAIVATDADAEAEEASAASRRSNSKRSSRSGAEADGGGGPYSMQSGGNSYGQSASSGTGRRSRRLGTRRSHRTIAEGDEPAPGGEEEEDDDEEEEEDEELGGTTPISAPKRRSTHDSRFNEVGLEDEEEEEEGSGGGGGEAEWVAAQRRRRRAAAAAAEAAERAEEEELRNGRKMWWTEWLCGCGRHEMDEDEQQHGKTNPMG